MTITGHGRFCMLSVWGTKMLHVILMTGVTKRAQTWTMNMY